MNKRNYQRILENTLEEISNNKAVPSLLLHSCCGPCSSYVLEYLSQYFNICVYYYNPNIYPKEEFFIRSSEQKSFIERFQRNNPMSHKIKFIEGAYEKDKFYEMAKGLEEEPERGARCHKCYRMRLSDTARTAKENGYDYFTTTLSISPQKDSQVLNAIGKSVSEEYGVKYLYSDFKKKNGYLRSTEISKEYGMYRQNYCGCEFSMREVKENQ